MDISTNLPVIAGVEITVDSEGRYNLNALHKASGLGASKAPAQWLRNNQAQDFIKEIIDVQICTSPVSTSKGGADQGTFAHELVAVEYAGWISPAFRIKVNQTFIDYRTGKYEAKPAKPKRERISSQLRDKLILARAAASMLRMSATSKARMLAEIAESEGIAPKFLPSYSTDEALTKSMTDLLKDHGSNISRNVALAAMIGLGLIEKAHRTSRSSPTGIAEFNSLTEAGLVYGRNETSRQNPNETQVRLYVDKFRALLERIEAYVDAHPKGKSNGAGDQVGMLQ